MGMAPNPLSTTDIWSYFNLIGVEISSYELDVIQALDNVALASFTKDKKDK